MLLIASTASCRIASFGDESARPSSSGVLNLLKARSSPLTNERDVWGDPLFGGYRIR